jgi:hypothetical protein
MILHEFLLSQGYKHYGKDPIHNKAILYQKTYPGKTGKKFINMYEWEFREDVTFYRIECRFETVSGVWATTEFYNLKKTDIIANLESYEIKLLQAFDLFEGVGQ